MGSVQLVRNSFSAVTFNVLAAAYAHRDRYPQTPAEALEPARRLDLLLRRIDGLDADLLCLQELEPNVLEALLRRLAPSHHHVYEQRRGRPDGSAIFARRDRLRWLGHEVLHFAAHRAGDDDLAVIARLALGDRALCVVSTHLAWQPDSTPRHQHVGYQQMIELVAHRDATAPAATWIFAGDFNAISDSVVLAAALERGMDESCRSQRPWDTCAINGRPRKIDYLLFSTGALVPRPGVLPKLYRDSALPSFEEPSDHLPLQVDFDLP
jgi:mRNA deadenylase 3'-5' endonuclease subunit Ccr4